MVHHGPSWFIMVHHHVPDSDPAPTPMMKRQSARCVQKSWLASAGSKMHLGTVGFHIKNSWHMAVQLGSTTFGIHQD